MAKTKSWKRAEQQRAQLKPELPKSRVNTEDMPGRLREKGDLKHLKLATEVKLTHQLARELKPGEQVRWSSQANGSAVEKRGKVVAQVPHGTDAWSLLSANGPHLSESHVKCGRISDTLHRVLVEVPRQGSGGKALPSLFYAPDVGRLARSGYVTRTL